MSPCKFPKGWYDSKIQSIISHYESQSQEDAVKEDEAVLGDRSQTLMEVALVTQLLLRNAMV
jgi:hypothetical protein